MTDLAATLRTIEANLINMASVVSQLAESIQGSASANEMAMAEIRAECALRGVVVAEDETVDEEGCGMLIGRRPRTMINRRLGSSKNGPLVQPIDDAHPARYALRDILEYRKNRNR